MEDCWQKLKEKYGEKLKENINLAPFTTLKIGGPAKGFFQTDTENQLIEIVKDCSENNIQFLVIGGGSNLLVSDDGVDQLVIKVGSTGIKDVNGEIFVQAGSQLQQLVDFTIDHGLDGMSTMTGIPGTVGGAIYGSAGAYGDNVRDYVKEIKCLDGSEIKLIPKDQYDTGYRDSIFKKNKNLIILEIVFSGFPKGDPGQLRLEAADVIEKRKKKYNPQLLTPGSFFKNIPEADLPPEQLEKVRQKISSWESNPEYIKRFGDKKVVMFGKIPAGNLIDMLGGKGDRIGNIVIDQFHANTFINTGDGTAKDFWSLAKKWHDKVKEEFDIELEPEVQFVNLPPLS